MAMAEGKLSGSKARDLYKQLLHGKGRERVEEPRNLRAYLNPSHKREETGSGDIEGLAGNFDRLALIRDDQPEHYDSAAEERDVWRGLQRDSKGHWA